MISKMLISLLRDNDSSCDIKLVGRQERRTYICGLTPIMADIESKRANRKVLEVEEGNWDRGEELLNLL